jgi:hypothetical protein
MTLRLKLLLAVALAAFAACHVAAIYQVEASNVRPSAEIVSLLRD